MRRVAAVIAAILVVSLVMTMPVSAQSTPKGLRRLDLHATIACTGVEVAASRVFLLGQAPDPALLFNVITAFTRSKTKGARKQAASLQAATGDVQFTAIDNALTWCTGRGYKRRTG